MKIIFDKHTVIALGIITLFAAPVHAESKLPGSCISAPLPKDVAYYYEGSIVHSGAPTLDQLIKIGTLTEKDSAEDGSSTLGTGCTYKRRQYVTTSERNINVRRLIRESGAKENDIEQNQKPVFVEVKKKVSKGFALSDCPDFSREITYDVYVVPTPKAQTCAVLDNCSAKLSTLASIVDLSAIKTKATEAECEVNQYKKIAKLSSFSPGVSQKCVANVPIMGKLKVSPVVNRFELPVHFTIHTYGADNIIRPKTYALEHWGMGSEKQRIDIKSAHDVGAEKAKLEKRIHDWALDQCESALNKIPKEQQSEYSCKFSMDSWQNRLDNSASSETFDLYDSKGRVDLVRTYIPSNRADYKNKACDEIAACMANGKNSYEASVINELKADVCKTAVSENLNRDDLTKCESVSEQEMICDGKRYVRDSKSVFDQNNAVKSILEAVPRDSDSEQNPTASPAK